MKFKVVSYVKRKHYGTNEISDAYKVYCEYTGMPYQLGWNFDFWLGQLMTGKEFHVLDMYDGELLDQYMIDSEDININDNGSYYQFNLFDEER